MGVLPYLEALLATTPVGRFPRALPIDCLGMFFVFFGMRGVRARSCGWARCPGSIWGGLALLWQNPVGKSRRFIAPRRAHAHAHAHVGCLALLGQNPVGKSRRVIASSAHAHLEGFDPRDVG